MLVNFKKNADSIRVYKINTDNVELVLARSRPWLKKEKFIGDDQYFATCPYCNNPIQLKGLYRYLAKPYGIHAMEPVKGFTFNLKDLAYCPYQKGMDQNSKNVLREYGNVPEKIIDIAVSEFDHIISVLSKGFEFDISNTLAEHMLDQWFRLQGYRYYNVHLRNIPWMIAYFGSQQNMSGEYIGRNKKMAKNIKNQMPQVRFSEEGQLQDVKEPCQLGLHCMDHRMRIDRKTGDLVETMQLHIQDFSKTDDLELAPTIYKKKIRFQPERFEALCCNERNNRNQELLDIAKALKTKWLPQLPELPKETPITPDFGAIFEYTDPDTGKDFGVTLATLLQCLCIAEQQHIVPPFDSEWEKIAIPPVIRERAQTVDKDKIDV